mgnify:CR=1 FL=1
MQSLHVDAEAATDKPALLAAVTACTQAEDALTIVIPGTEAARRDTADYRREGNEGVCSAAEVLAEFEGKGYAMLKASVAEAVISTLDPIQQRYRELSAEPEALDAILDSGAERARPLAGATLERVKRAMGLDAPPPPPGARLSAIA